MSLPNDNFGRAVTLSTIGNQDIYTITSTFPPYPNAVFTLTYPTGTAEAQVYQTINSCYPEGYVPPAQPAASQPLGNTGVTVDNDNNLSANALVSTVETGTPPLVVTSTTAVPNLTASFVVTNANMTGPITSIGNTTSVASQTGTGSTFVMDASPTLITPILGTPTSGTLTNCTGLPLSTGTTGTLSLTNGGTNASLTASNGGIFYSTSNAAAILSGTSTANQVLLSGASTTPSWSSATYPPTTTINQLLYSSATNTISGLATVNSAILVTSSGGIPSWSSTLTNGQIIVGSTGSTPSAVSVSGDATLASNGALALATVNSNVGTFGSTSQVAQITVNAKGLITAASNIALSASPVGSALTSANIWVGNASNAAAEAAVSGDATLSNTGALTLATVNTSSGSTTLSSITTNAKGLVTSNTTGNLTGDITSTGLSTTYNNTVPLTKGGTNASLTASNGGVVYSNSSQLQILSGTATANQILLSGSSTTPSWSTATYPSTTTINQLLYSSAANTISELATVNSAILTTNGSGVPSWVAYTGTGAPVLANTPTLITPSIGAATGTSLSVSGQLTSTVSTGTAPLVVSSTTQVANLTATNTINTEITDDPSTNATMYPIWVTATSGQNPQKVSSTKLTWNPSTGTLSSPVFSSSGSSTFTSTTPATSSSTGAIVVSGGAGISKNIWVGSSFTNSSSITAADGAIINIPALTYTNTNANSATLSNLNIVSVNTPTLASTGTSTTVTNAASLYIASAPTAGTNVTITNPYAIQVVSGDVSVGGNLVCTGAINSSNFSTVVATTGVSSAPNSSVQTGTMTWTTTTPLSTATFTSICFGGNLFVAIASNGTTSTQIYTSTDAVVWTARTSPNAQAWQSVCFAEDLNRFVAVANNGAVGTQIMSSTDGVTWTASTSSSATTWSSVCRSSRLTVGLAGTGTGNTFVAVANVATTAGAMISNAGTGTWTASTCVAATGGGWLDVCWSDDVNLFVAVGSSTSAASCVMTSPTGLTGTWTAATASASGTWTSVCWSSYLSMFVAVNSGGTTACVMSSYTGTGTWSARNGIAVTGGWKSVCWSPVFLMFVVVGGSAGNGAVMTSPDGINWTSRSVPASNAWSAVCFSNPKLGLFCAVSSTAAVGNSMYSTAQPAGFNTTLTIGTVGTTNMVLQGASILVNESPIYYAEGSSAVSIAAINTFQTDLTIYDVPNGLYLAYIFMQCTLKTANGSFDATRIIGSVQGTIYTTTALNSYAGTNGAAGTVGLPITFQFLVKIFNSSGPRQNVSYQIYSTGAAAYFPAGSLRTFYLKRLQ